METCNIEKNHYSGSFLHALDQRQKEKHHPDYSATRGKSRFCGQAGVVSVLLVKVIYTSVKAEISELLMLPKRSHLFQVCSCIFHTDNAKPNCDYAQSPGWRMRRLEYCIDPPAVSTHPQQTKIMLLLLWMKCFISWHHECQNGCSKSGKRFNIVTQQLKWSRHEWAWVHVVCRGNEYINVLPICIHLHFMPPNLTLWFLLKRVYKQFIDEWITSVNLLNMCHCKPASELQFGVFNLTDIWW